ncbi:MAG TPA: NTP transferase domain-containing protein [Pilimelia sp.]|nr:NTP transferase domain-containing protein [Pilimelia sp.]
MGLAAVVLAGGAGRRLGGAVKPALPVAGQPMVSRVLAAVADACPRIVVGPAALGVPPGVLLTREDPPGGGPVAGAAAGLALVPPTVAEVALLAADLPLLDAAAVAELRRTLAAGDWAAAVYVDRSGRRQNLCGVWRADALRAALAGRVPVRGAAVRELFSGVRVAEVSWAGAGAPPWFDCDTDADLRRAQEWAR